MKITQVLEILNDRKEKLTGDDGTYRTFKTFTPGEAL